MTHHNSEYLHTNILRSVSPSWLTKAVPTYNPCRNSLSTNYCKASGSTVQICMYMYGSSSILQKMTLELSAFCTTCTRLIHVYSMLNEAATKLICCNTIFQGQRAPSLKKPCLHNSLDIPYSEKFYGAIFCK